MFYIVYGLGLKHQCPSLGIGFEKASFKSNSDRSRSILGKIQTDDGAVVAIVTADAGARVSVNEVMTGTVVMARL